VVIRSDLVMVRWWLEGCPRVTQLWSRSGSVVVLKVAQWWFDSSSRAVQSGLMVV
jgi:hypothetical protein